MEATKRDHGKATIIDVSGEVDAFNASKLRDLLRSLVEQQKFQTIINLQRVPYIDSTGIGALLAFLNEMKKNGGDIFLCELSPVVRKVFQITRLDTFFRIFATEMEALAALTD